MHLRLQLLHWRETVDGWRDLRAAYLAGKERGGKTQEAQLSTINAALHESADKSAEMLARYADFKLDYEAERAQIERNAVQLASEGALLSARLVERRRGVHVPGSLGGVVGVAGARRGGGRHACDGGGRRLLVICGVARRAALPRGCDGRTRYLRE